MIRHLEMGAVVWCETEDEEFEVTEDPRDATCQPCLKIAAAYGAAAAMRYAAVEAGPTADPELVRERDEAMRRLNKMSEALSGQGAFFCNGCMKLFRTSELGVKAGSLSWCDTCAPHRKVPT